MPSSISLVVPWSPTLRGKRILPCPLIKNLVSNQVVPREYMPNDRPWALPSLAELMEGVSTEGKAALGEGVIALWRFKVVEAWLVRCLMASISGAG